MTAALTLITDAYQMVGLLGEGEPLTDARAQFGFRRLNNMLDSWATDSLFVQTINKLTGSISPGQSFTVGPTGNVISPTVPIRLEQGCFFRISGIDYPMQFISREAYMNLPFKSISTQWPQFIYYEPGASVGTCHIYPALSAVAVAHLQVMAPLTAFATLTANVTLPMGCTKAIEESLAEQLCVGKKQVPPQLAKSAATARSRIRNANVNPPELRDTGRGGEDIYTGWVV